MTSSMNNNDGSINFEDELPRIAERLGGEALIGELCKGFELLKDAEKGVITYESLKTKASLLGLGELKEEELRAMMEEGDYDGDGVLCEMEFCVLMFRLSPQLMLHAKTLFLHEFHGF